MIKTNHIILSLFLLILFTGCTSTSQEDVYNTEAIQLSPVVTAYYEKLGILDELQTTGTTEVFLFTKSEHFFFSLPIYWEELYIINGNQEPTVTFYDRYNYEQYDGLGQLWQIRLCPKETFSEIYKKEFADAYESYLDANSAIIAEDEDYVYILSLPTDGQFMLDDQLATELYQTHADNRQRIVADFIKNNHLMINKKMPELN